MNLSDSQQKIIDCKDPNIIVDAGSGSGKTRTLTEKVRCVLQSGVDPKSVVVITFTNLAADELRRRLVDVPNSDKCFIGTIHSYANHVLRKTGKKYDIYSFEYELEFMKILIPKYSRYCSIDDYTLLLRLRKQQESGKVKASEIPYRFTDVKVYKELLYLLGEEQNYQYTETVKTLCKLNNIITFDELLELSTKYFDDSKTVLDYLFVDELQDIGYLEYNFLMRLKSKHNFFIGDDYQCQPHGTLVTMEDGSVKKIEDVVCGDYVLSYNRNEGHYYRKSRTSKGKVVKSVQKSISDTLIHVSCGNIRTSYTPNHRCYAKINYTEATKGYYVVYMMENEDGQFRIGKTQLFLSYGKHFGVRARMNMEGAVNGWILKVCKTDIESWECEQICSYKFGIPQITWVDTATKYGKDTVKRLYENLPDIRQKADNCLTYFGRDIKYPLFIKDKNIHFSKLHITEVRACNLIPEIMSMAVPTYDEEHHKYYHTFYDISSVETEKGVFDVYCLEVEGTGIYVADGILTHNSIYAFKGGDVNIFLSLMRNEDWASFYLTENYRTVQSILAYANMIVQKSNNIIKKDYICKNSQKGELKFETKTRIDNFIKSIPTNEDWMFLTRTNKELSILESIFKKCGVPYYCVRQAVESEEERQKILAKSNIKIMTVHKSKGLECDNVALYGKFPIKDTKDTDEYKVFYVGITRAKNKCCVFV